MDANQNTAGTLLTCSDPNCGCELQINVPCPHGHDYQCACGHAFEAKQQPSTNQGDAESSMRTADRANGESSS